MVLNVVGSSPICHPNKHPRNTQTSNEFARMLFLCTVPYMHTYRDMSKRDGERGEKQEQGMHQPGGLLLAQWKNAGGR